MRSTYDIKTLDRLQREGKIRGYVAPIKVQTEAGRIVSKHFKKRSAEKEWLSWNLLFFCNENCLTLKEEYRFDRGGRKWRSDYCIESLKVLIEYEGLISDVSRHTTIKGYSADTDKYREAAKQGWIVLRYTALNYRNVLNDIRSELLKTKNQCVNPST